MKEGKAASSAVSSQVSRESFSLFLSYFERLRWLWNGEWLALVGWSWLSSDFRDHKATETSKSIPGGESGTQTPHFTGLCHRLGLEPLALAPLGKPKIKFQALSEEPGKVPDAPDTCSGCGKYLPGPGLGQGCD